MGVDAEIPLDAVLELLFSAWRLLLFSGILLALESLPRYYSSERFSFGLAYHLPASFRPTRAAGYDADFSQEEWSGVFDKGADHFF